MLLRGLCKEHTAQQVAGFTRIRAKHCYDCVNCKSDIVKLRTSIEALQIFTSGLPGYLPATPLFTRTLTSTRRFSARPTDVSFEATA